MGRADRGLTARMKIATFNINNVNKRLANLLGWLAAAEPDVVCLQELKATDSQFPHAAIAAAGYGAVWRGQPTWNGVAILARDVDPIMTRDALPGDPADTLPTPSGPVRMLNVIPLSPSEIQLQRTQGTPALVAYFDRHRVDFLSPRDDQQ